jgi:MATE family multidrug resistance protein
MSQNKNNDNPNHSFALEIRLFFALVLPTVLTNLCRTAMGLTDVSILGHYHPPPQSSNISNSTVPSTQFLAAAGYTVTWLSMANTIVVQGFAAAITVLGANAFGAGNYRLLGYYLQIALTTSTIGGLAVCGATWYAGDIMQLLIGFDNNMHGLVQKFSRVMLVGYFPLVWTTCLNSWLISQKQTTPQLLTFLTCVGINVGLNILFIYGMPQYGWSGFGFLGSALATSVSRWLQFIVMTTIVCRQVRKRAEIVNDEDSKIRTNSQQWDVGFIPLPSASELQDERMHFDWSMKRSHTSTRVRTYMAQACPLALTGLLEDGQIQFIGILAGRLGTIAAATHNGIFQVFWFLSSFMWAVSAATRVRISGYLGSGDEKGAKFGVSVATIVALPSSAVVAISLVLLREEVGKVFSHDPRVLLLVSQIMLLCGCGYFFLGIFYICMATLTAQGRPHLIAVSFVVGAWLVCIPMAFYLKHSDIIFFGGISMSGLFGLWFSMSAGYGVTSLLAAISVCRTDWGRVVRESLARAECLEEDGYGDEFFDDLNSQRDGGINRSGASTPTFGDGVVGGGYYTTGKASASGGGDGVNDDDLLLLGGKRRIIFKKVNRHDSLLQPLI